MSTDPLIKADRVSFAYNGHEVLHAVNLALTQGGLSALVGPNGSGKTTLLKLLCGILRPQAGQVLWQGKLLASIKRREAARRIALVPQELNVPFAFTVAEIVSLGRTPYVRSFLGESASDRSAVTRALELTGTARLADRFFGDLSGGERQRAVVAMALAQVAAGIEPGQARAGSDGEPPALLLLDEPTVHLDINHQIEILEMLHTLNREYGLTVLATMHDLNLASLYFDRMVLLSEGQVVIEGTPVQVLSKERVESIFGADVLVEGHPVYKNVPQVILLPANGNGKEKALQD